MGRWGGGEVGRWVDGGMGGWGGEGGVGADLCVRPGGEIGRGEFWILDFEFVAWVRRPGLWRLSAHLSAAVTHG